MVTFNKHVHFKIFTLASVFPYITLFGQSAVISA